MTIDISIQQIAATLILGTLAWIGFRYGDSGTKYAHWFFIGGLSVIILIGYWIYCIMSWII